ALVRPRERPHVALDVRGLHPGRRRTCAGDLEETGRRVEARHTRTAGGESIRAPPVAARDVQDTGSGLEIQQPPDQLGIRVANFGKRRLVEIEVVDVEYLVEIERPLGHAPLLRSPVPGTLVPGTCA